MIKSIGFDSCFFKNDKKTDLLIQFLVNNWLNWSSLISYTNDLNFGF